MALIFINGDGPDYLGYKFGTSIELIDKLDFELTNAGWTKVGKVAGTSLLMRGNSIANNHNCYVQFTISNYTAVTNGKYLNVSGWLAESSNQSTVRSLTFIESTQSMLAINRLWLTADQEAGCLAIFGSNGDYGGIHFGFLDRIDNTDQWAWMVGLIHARGYVYGQVAKAKYDNSIWQTIGPRYTTKYCSYDNFAGTTQNFPMSTVDFMVRGKNYYHNTFADASNAFLNPPSGRLNYDGNPVIDSYYYLEATSNGSGFLSQQLYFRGNVKFAYTGTSTLKPMQQVIDSKSGYRFLAIGPGWQAMRIL